MQITDEMVEAACKAHAPQWERMDAEIKAYARGQMRAALIAALLQFRADAEPAAYLHVMHMEGGQQSVNVTLSRDHGWGDSGIHYDPSYTVTTVPLFPPNEMLAELMDEALEILNGLADNIKRRGNYSPEATCTFIDQAAQCLREAARAVKGGGDE